MDFSCRDLEKRRRRMSAGVLSLKLIEEQPQILRLTIPKLKDVWGPVRSE
jgi:hypothetical protein